MKCFNRHGQFKVVTGTGTGDYDLWPMVLDDTDGLWRYVRAATVDGVVVLWLEEASPKVEDDNDGLWRWLRSTSAGGTPALYLSTEADGIPGKEATVWDYTTGLLKTVRSRHIEGVPTIYLADI